MLSQFRKWFRFTSSQSRWGITALLYAVSLFFLALSPSFYSIYLSTIGGTVMLPFEPEIAFVFAIITGVIGVIIGLFATVVCIYMLFTYSEDPTEKAIREIKQDVSTIKVLLNKKGGKQKGNSP